MPIKRQSLAEEVASRLQSQISEGKFSAGEKLPSEPELMQLFGVGRSTIREAVRILSNLGMVRVQQGSGTYVESPGGIAEPLHKRLQRAKAGEINEVRQLLELKMAEKAALHRTRKDIEKMKLYLDKREQAARINDRNGCIEADILFHIAIAEAAKNDILADLYRTFSTILKSSFMQVYINTESFVQTQPMHTALLQSIIEQDPKKAWSWAAKITGQFK